MSTDLARKMTAADSDLRYMAMADLLLKLQQDASFCGSGEMEKDLLPLAINGVHDSN